MIRRLFVNLQRQTPFAASFLMASQDLSLADFVIPPEFFPAGGAPQHLHIGTLLPASFSYPWMSPPSL
jgi:hypothetical protein